MSNTNEKPNHENLHEYALMQHPARELTAVKILIKDAMPVKCHKVPHSIVPTQIEGQYAKEYEPCSTHCSRCQLVKSEGQLYVFQTCEAIPNKFLITNAELKPKGKLEVVK